MILQNIFVLVAVSRGFTRGTWKASFPPFLLCGNPHLSSSFQRPSGSNVGSSAHQCCCEGGSRRETLRFEGRTTNPLRHVHNKTLTSGTQDHKASSQCVSCVDCKVTGTTHCGLLRRRLEGDCANRQHNTNSRMLPLLSTSALRVGGGQARSLGVRCCAPRKTRNATRGVWRSLGRECLGRRETCKTYTAAELGKRPERFRKVWETGREEPKSKFNS